MGGENEDKNQNIQLVSPYAPVIETPDEAYKQAVARDFALKLRAEKRRAILHKIYLVEAITLGVSMFVGLVSLGSNDGFFVMMRLSSGACMVLIAITAIIQGLIASNPDTGK